jgi:hypothetical protein
MKGSDTLQLIDMIALIFCELTCLWVEEVHDAEAKTALCRRNDADKELALEPDLAADTPVQITRRLNALWDVHLRVIWPHCGKLFQCRYNTRHRRLDRKISVHVVWQDPRLVRHGSCHVLVPSARVLSQVRKCDLDPVSTGGRCNGNPLRACRVVGGLAGVNDVLMMLGAAVRSRRREDQRQADSAPVDASAASTCSGLTNPSPRLALAAVRPLAPRPQ